MLCAKLAEFCFIHAKLYIEMLNIAQRAALLKMFKGVLKYAKVAVKFLQPTG